MSTYQNCYRILTDVRGALNESDNALIQGSSTYGKYSNTFLVERINRAQRALYAKLFIRVKSLFIASASITGSSSVFALPWDVGVIRRFEDEQGQKVFPAGLDDKPVNSGSGSRNIYYRSGNNLILMQSNVSATYKLYYLKKPRELNTGAASGTNTLATTARALADYYNGMILENETDGTVHTISDYSATRVVTLDTGSLASGKYYGIVPDMPEPFHHLIAPLAAMFAKADHPVAPEKPVRSSVELWQGELDDAILAFGGRSGDIPDDDIWTSGVSGYAGGMLIPGHTGLVF